MENTPEEVDLPQPRLPITRLIVRTLAGQGTAYIVGQSITTLVGSPETKVQKILDFSGRMAIGMFVTNIVKKDVDNMIDDYVTLYDESKIVNADIETQIDQAEQGL